MVFQKYHSQVCDVQLAISSEAKVGIHARLLLVFRSRCRNESLEGIQNIRLERVFHSHLTGPTGVTSHLLAEIPLLRPLALLPFLLLSTHFRIPSTKM